MVQTISVFSVVAGNRDSNGCKNSSITIIIIKVISEQTRSPSFMVPLTVVWSLSSSIGKFRTNFILRPVKFRVSSLRPVLTSRGQWPWVVRVWVANIPLEQFITVTFIVVSNSRKVLGREVTGNWNAGNLVGTLFIIVILHRLSWKVTATTAFSNIVRRGLGVWGNWVRIVNRKVRI